jgi:hypothetical protein
MLYIILCDKSLEVGLISDKHRSLIPQKARSLLILRKIPKFGLAQISLKFI